MIFDRNCPSVGGAYISEGPQDFAGGVVLRVEPRKRNVLLVDVAFYRNRPSEMFRVFAHPDHLRVALETNIAERNR